MNARRFATTFVLGAITLVQVALCRLRFGKRAPALNAADLNTAPVLVIRCEAKLGDNLLNIPFLRALRSAYPGRPIHLLHHVSARGVYQHCPYVDERIEIDWPMSAPATLLRRIGLSADVVRKGGGHGRYAVAFLPRWDEDLYAPFVAWISGAPRIVGFSRKVLPEKARRNIGTDLLLTDAIMDMAVRHESVRPLQLLERVSGPGQALSTALEFWFSDEDMAEVMSHAGVGTESETTWIAIAPGAALDRRKWPLERFVQVVQALVVRADVRLMFLGAAAEKADCDELARVCLSARSVNFAGRITLSQSAAALSICRLFVGNDSGLMHLASAVHTPIIEVSCHPMHAGLLHANSPARFGPTSKLSAVLRPPRALALACRDGCTSNVAHCITTVAADAVIRTAEKFLGASETTGLPHERQIE